MVYLGFTVQEFQAPAPEAYFYFYPYDPSVFDTVWFDNWSYDPAGIGFESQVWNFGDGNTSTEWTTSHQYTADGDYTVQLTVTTYDGRSASTSPTVQVRTHDVAIAKFAVPGAAKAGQTRTIVVGLSSKRYFEEVEVQLFKRVPGGNTWHPTLGPRREAGYPAYAELPTRILVELAGLQAEMRAALGSVRVPVLLIHSRQDAAAPPDSMPQIYQALGTEDKEMLWLEGFDHAVVRDPKRAEAFEAIAAFLERVTGSG